MSAKPGTGRRLGPEQFEAIRPFVKMSDTRLRAARRSLVDGVSMDAVAKEFGWTHRNNVYAAVSKVWVKWKELEKANILISSGQVRQNISDGWEELTLIAPKDLIPDIQEQIISRIKKSGTNSDKK